MSMKRLKRRHPEQVLIVGVTGSFGSGKTTVAKFFGACGMRVIDADAIAHACLGTGSSAYRRIAALFGRGILGPDKTINRRLLAEAAFGNRGLVRKLNAIVHPQVIRAIRQNVADMRGGWVVIDAPLLIESGLHKLCDYVIVVRSKREIQIRRMTRKFSLSRRQVVQRLSAQLSLRAKRGFADFIIDNSATKIKTKRQVQQVCTFIKGGKTWRS